MYKIEKNIKMSERRFAGGRRSMYPFAGMEAGNSFFVPVKDGVHPHAHRMNVGSSARGWAKRNAPNVKFICRQTEENGVLGVRIWRIE